jgi:hypothetical protein
VRQGRELDIRRTGGGQAQDLSGSAIRADAAGDQFSGNCERNRHLFIVTQTA